MYFEALNQIMFGGEFSDTEIPRAMNFLREFLDIDELFAQNGRQEESDEDDEIFLDDQLQREDGVNQINSLQINEPNLNQMTIPEELTNNQYLQSNPKERTLLRQIGIRNSFNGGQSNVTRHSAVIKYPIYAFSDLHYASTEEVKLIYDKVLNDTLHKTRHFKNFNLDYYDQLLQNFSVLNESQIKDHLQQNKESEILLDQLRKQRTIVDLEKNLTKYTQLSNESKEQYFILSQETVNHIPPSPQSNQFDCQILNNVRYYQELDAIVNRKKVKLNDNKSCYSNINEKLNQLKDDQIDLEKNIRKVDNEKISKYFSKKYNLFQHQSLNSNQGIVLEDQIKTLPKISTYLNQNPVSNELSTFKFWGEIDEPGKALQSRIISQLEIDKKLNEQQRDKQIEVEDPQDDFNQKEFEFQKALDSYLVFNKEVVEFCSGKLDNFLTKPFSTYNRVEIDLSNPQFFSEKLEVLLHLKKQPEKYAALQLARGGAPSVISRQDNRSVLSNLKLPSVTEQQEADSQDLSQDESEFDQQNLNHSIMNDDNNNKELTALIENKIKNRFPTPPINNSLVAEGFALNDFSQDVHKHSHYHRSNILEILYLEKETFLGLEREKVKHFDPWKVQLVPLKSQKEKLKDMREVLLEELPEKLNSQEYYKNVESLSLSKGNFILFEYIEQRPIILNNTGMCTKASRYVYGQRSLNQFQKMKYQDEPDLSSLYGMKQERQISMEDQSLMDFKNMLVDKLGKIGQIKFLERNEQIPLQGQLYDEKVMGITVIENDLYRAPVFKQKLPATDFLLVRQREVGCQFKYVLRPIDCIYLVGQIEPKQEIYTPHSRPLGTFLKNYLRTFIKKLFKEDQEVNSEQLYQEIFQRKQSHQNIRNALKDCKGEQDTQNQKTWRYRKGVGNDDQILKYDISANQVCLYESMLHSSYLLQQFGLKDLKNSDKMKKTLQVFLTRHPENFQDWVIARRIEDELNMTAWSLSASFLHSTNQTGRMLLYGPGDPTSGHGGLNYIKKPLKARGEKAQNAVLEKKPQVMGTDKDLRKLHVQDIQTILTKLGKTADQIGNLKRWKMINLVTQFIQQARNPDDQESYVAITFKKNLELLNHQERHQLEVIENFAKNQRLTTKKQKEQYQKELDSQLNCLIQNLSLTVQSNYFEDYAEIKQLRVKRKMANDDKTKDLEYNSAEIEPYLIATSENYKLQLKAYLMKEKKIWLDKKKKKGLPL